MVWTQVLSKHFLSSTQACKGANAPAFCANCLRLWRKAGQSTSHAKLSGLTFWATVLSEVLSACSCFPPMRARNLVFKKKLRKQTWFTFHGQILNVCLHNFCKNIFLGRQRFKTFFFPSSSRVLLMQYRLSSFSDWWEKITLQPCFCKPLHMCKAKESWRKIVKRKTTSLSNSFI